MTIDEYRALRAKVIDAGYANELEWAETVRPPETADDFAGEAIWVICCSGFKEQRARGVEARVLEALRTGKSATTVFPKSAKGRVIDDIWRNRTAHFGVFRGLLNKMTPDLEIVDWIAELPYLGGPILRWHFAKNLGLNVAKPDRWLERVVASYGNGETVADLCARLSRQSGDRIATVDLVIWRACNLGIWKTAYLPGGPMALPPLG